MTDNAKELLALADEMVVLARAVNHGDDLDRGVVPFTLSHAADALRLSARQQVSVEWERLTSIIRPLIESVCSDGGSDAARLAKAISDALLAKYDILRKWRGER